MDYAETKDLIYKPKRFIVVKVILIIINMLLNLLYRFLKFLWTTIVSIRRNKQICIRHAIAIFTFIKNLFKK